MGTCMSPTTFSGLSHRHGGLSQSPFRWCLPWPTRRPRCWPAQHCSGAAQCSGSGGRPQLARGAEDRLVEEAAKFPAAATLPVFSGSHRQLRSCCCVTEAMRVLADRTDFGSRFSSSWSGVLCVTLKPVFQASCTACWKVRSVDVCSCLFMNLCIL